MSYSFRTPASGQSTSGAAGVFKTVRHQIASLVSANISLRNKRVALEKRVRTLREQLNAVRHDKGAVLAKLDKRTARSIEEIEKVVAMTGLDPDKLIAKLTPDGQGGPVETIVAANDPDDAFTLRALSLQRRLHRWQKLEQVLRHMPLIAPLDHYRKSSGFGVRRDPINGQLGMHNGVDFAYLLNTPVLSTAPGKVVFAGWRGGYGWMIEIDHGMGIRTRYAHLKKILVAKGQTVAFREKIGLLGSTGHSSGPHVHYEVVIDGRPQNPIKFITAGKYVFKG